MGQLRTAGYINFPFRRATSIVMKRRHLSPLRSTWKKCRASLTDLQAAARQHGERPQVR